MFLLGACALGFLTRYVMLDVYPQHGLWILGGFAICRLPEFALGMSLAMWHRQSPERVEWFLLRGAGFIAGLVLYPAALKLYENGIAYVFCDFATGACCFLEIVGVAGIISRFAVFSKIFCVIGAYSYGIYLIHQPYVIWLGLRIRPQPIAMFLLIFLVTLAVLSAWGIVLEKGTNKLVTKFIWPKKAAPA
jgi:peptidoglycan/LPS O-acetylase OafA/YrhL